MVDNNGAGQSTTFGRPHHGTDNERSVPRNETERDRSDHGHEKFEDKHDFSREEKKVAMTYRIVSFVAALAVALLVALGLTGSSNAAGANNLGWFAPGGAFANGYGSNQGSGRFGDGISFFGNGQNFIGGDAGQGNFRLKGVGFKQISGSVTYTVAGFSWDGRNLGKTLDGINPGTGNFTSNGETLNKGGEYGNTGINWKNGALTEQFGSYVGNLGNPNSEGKIAAGSLLNVNGITFGDGNGSWFNRSGRVRVTSNTAGSGRTSASFLN